MRVGRPRSQASQLAVRPHRFRPPIDPVRWQPPPSRALPGNATTSGELHVVALSGNAPEDVVADAAGAIWTGTDDGSIWQIDPDGSPRRVANTGGRPLGLAISRDGRVLICDSHRGLLRLDPDSGNIEELVIDVGGRPLRFCSNVVESRSGIMYFTQSTERFDVEHYKGAYLEARWDGALYRRDIDGTVTVLADGLAFANGVALTPDESAVVVAETARRRVSRYPLRGSGVGAPVPLIENLPGYPDNISAAPDGAIWVAMAGDRNRIGEWLQPRAPMLRRLLWRLPYRWLPDPTPTVWVIAIDSDDGRVRRQVRTRDRRFASVTGVVERDGRLWLGCIGSPAVAWLTLREPLS